VNLPPGAIRVTEGKTQVFVPEIHSVKGPGKRVGRVFYNAQMAFNRDVSVMFFDAVPLEGKVALDAMAATGVRTARVLNESASGARFVVNDKDSEACEFIAANLEGQTERVECANENLVCLLAKKVFDYIDLDPFGTPVPFVSSAIQGCKRNGILAITATDTAALAGTHVKKCMRRYMSRSARSPFGHETGLRILLGYLAKEAAQHDRGVEPLLCYYADHYFRLHVRLPTNAAAADRSLANLGFVSYDRDSDERRVCEADDARAAGPLWLGPIADKALINQMEVREGLAEPERCARYLSAWKEELDVPYFYETSELASRLKISPPPLDDIIDTLRAHGRASRTHFSPSGFKTDLPLEEMIRVFPGKE
jgi:tRNA (guanine26-N2/guanine27-N2)-dimethyltransferase